MIECLLNNPNIAISICSLSISIIALLFSQKTARLSSYSQKGCYNIFLIRRGFLARMLKKRYDFTVKIYNSANSNVISFDYGLVISPKIGGVCRAQIFSAFDDKASFGINKTSPDILTAKVKHFIPKKYAYNSVTKFSSTPLYPYFSKSEKIDDNTRMCERKLNRYHFYIEIIDYCNNIEIWYMSFSLLLSNVKDERKLWRQCGTGIGYRYYTFDDICIVSPRDVPKNLNRANNFNKSLEKIEKISLDSTTLIEYGFNAINFDLQLFEMKEYISFLKILNAEKLK